MRLRSRPHAPVGWKQVWAGAVSALFQRTAFLYFARIVHFVQLALAAAYWTLLTGRPASVLGATPGVCVRAR
jgi:hypothetical protein